MSKEIFRVFGDTLVVAVTMGLWWTFGVYLYSSLMEPAAVRHKTAGFLLLLIAVAFIVFMVRFLRHKYRTRNKKD